MSDALPDEPAILMVTPYCRENRAVIARCIDSVAAQTVATTHLLIADGFAQDWIDAMPVRHIRLDRNHANYGNTPRAIGMLLGVGEGYDAIGLIDADNWLDPDHVATCLAAARSVPDADMVVARRRFRRVDGSQMPLAEEPVAQHVDTNCFFFLPGSYGIVPVWGTTPHPLAVICDRTFYGAAKGQGMVAAATDHPTVNYTVTLHHLYVALGESAPPGAKDGVDLAAVARWIDQLSPRERVIAQRRARIRLDTPFTARTQPPSS